MKNPKNLTFNQRAIVESWGLNSENWKREKIANGYILLRNALTNEQRQVPDHKKGEHYG